MAGIIHKFNGQWGTKLRWNGARMRQYQTEAAPGVSELWLVGKAEQARNFAIRFYEVPPGGHTVLEQHAHDHGIVVLQGEGRVQIGDEHHPIATGDVVYIPPNALHQLVSTSDEALGFLCVIPATRVKNGKEVWAEEGIQGLQTIGEDS